MRLRSTPLSLVLAVGALLLGLGRTGPPGGEPAFLGSPRAVAPGVSVYHVTDAGLLDPPGPVSIWLLRVDPARAEIQPVLAHDQILHRETVSDMAERHGALAAINAGFFLPNGDPSGIYKLQGQLVSEARRPRGAVGIVPAAGGGARLIFGRVSATMAVRILEDGEPGHRFEITGVDTTRLLGRLMLFTPAYHPHTDTAPGGLEWVIDGDPLRVVTGPHRKGKTRIPKSGYVLSFGGPRPPPDLAALKVGTRVDFETIYDSTDGGQDWPDALHIVGGAGLLARDGEFVDSWTIESFAPGFSDARHPRTMIGTGADGSIWLAAVDGRQPDLSAGMTLVELRELARRMRLTGALNLDGGGSTTMWVAGGIVNSPSDASGPRPVSDAMLVLPRQ